MLSDVGHGGEFERYSDYAVQVDFHAVGFCLGFRAERVLRRLFPDCDSGQPRYPPLELQEVGILIGLVCYIGGCTLFFPASHMATYGMFLMALFAIAVGLSFLETSCNTYSSMIGPKESSTLRLNISQTFTPVGFLSGILLGKYLIFTEGEALHRQMETLDGAGKQQLAAEMLQRTLQPYQFIIMVLVLLLVIVAITQFPRCKPLDKEEHETKATIGETLRYLACNSRFRFGIMAQFFYAGM